MPYVPKKKKENRRKKIEQCCKLLLVSHTLRSGLSAVGSGGQSSEEGSHLCFMYLKKKENRRKKIEQCCKLLLVLWGDLGADS